MCQKDMAKGYYLILSICIPHYEKQRHREWNIELYAYKTKMMMVFLNFD